MNFGFNSNVRAGEALYHVQTEDRGLTHPFFDTVVYEAGRVIYKRSTSYEDFARATRPESLPKLLHEKLAQQHREVLAELEAGTLPLNTPVTTALQHIPFIASEGLDVVLRNPKTWFASGSVTLEIELRRRNSGEEIGGADVEAFLERERERTPCMRAQADAAGRVTLKFQMPAIAGEGTSLVIRATDGSLYGDLRFQLKAKPRNSPAAPISK
jgi:hypothetical protein